MVKGPDLLLSDYNLAFIAQIRSRDPHGYLALLLLASLRKVSAGAPTLHLDSVGGRSRDREYAATLSYTGTMPGDNTKDHLGTVCIEFIYNQDAPTNALKDTMVVEIYGGVDLSETPKILLDEQGEPQCKVTLDHDNFHKIPTLIESGLLLLSHMD